MRDWTTLVFPAGARLPHHVLDGDLPKADWFGGDRTPLLSDADGEIHTVVPGRPIGLHPHTVAELAEQGVHLHFYGDFTHGQWRAWIESTRGLAPRHLHLHAAGRPGRVGAGVLPVRRRVAAHVRVAQRRRPAARRLGRPQLPGPAHHPRRRRRAADAARQQRARGRHAGARPGARASACSSPTSPTSASSCATAISWRGSASEVWRQRLDFSFDANADALVDSCARRPPRGRHRFPRASSDGDSRGA